MQRWILKCVASGVMLACAGIAKAAMIVADNFNTYTPTNALAGNNGGTNGSGTWSTAWTGSSSVVVASGGLNYTNGAVTISGGANSIVINGAANAAFLSTRPFGNVTGTVYFSFLFRTSDNFNSDDFLNFTLAGNTAQGEALTAGLGLLDTTTSLIHSRITGAGAADRTTVSSGTNAASSTTYFMVGRLSGDGADSAVNYDRLELFLNPSTLTQPVVASATSDRDMTISTLKQFNLRTVNLDSNDNYQFDELRIGTTWADVVPEPASLGLIGLVAMMAGRRRR